MTGGDRGPRNMPWWQKGGLKQLPHVLGTGGWGWNVLSGGCYVNHYTSSGPAGASRHKPAQTGLKREGSLQPRSLGPGDPGVRFPGSCTVSVFLFVYISLIKHPWLCDRLTEEGHPVGPWHCAQADPESRRPDGEGFHAGFRAGATFQWARRQLWVAVPLQG